MIITDDPPVALTFANDFCLFRWITSMDSNQFMVYVNSHHIVLSVLNNRCEWPYSQETLIFRHSNHRNFQYVFSSALFPLCLISFSLCSLLFSSFDYSLSQSVRHFYMHTSHFLSSTGLLCLHYQYFFINIAISFTFNTTN